MLSDEDRERLAADAQALRAWWRGDKAEPLVMEIRDAYTPCDVMFPSLAAKLGMNLRGLALLLISKVPCSCLKAMAFRLFGARIGRGVYIGPGAMIDLMYPSLVELGDGSFLALDCRVLAHEITATHFRLGRVRVGAGSVIGAFAIVRPGVTVGRKVTVGAHSLVGRDVPDECTVGGVPARPIDQSRGNQ